MDYDIEVKIAYAHSLEQLLDEGQTEGEFECDDERFADTGIARVVDSKGKFACLAGYVHDDGHFDLTTLD